MFVCVCYLYVCVCVCVCVCVFGVTVLRLLVKNVFNISLKTRFECKQYEIFSPKVLFHFLQAQKNERESIRQKLALGSFFDDGPGIYTSCSKSGKPSLSSR